MGVLTLGALLVHGLILVPTKATALSISTPWYLTRALAVSAYVSLTLSVMLGTLRTLARKSGERLSWIVDELHQFIATLSGVLVAGHLITLKLDQFIPFTLTNLFLPINEPYKPVPVELGVYALYAMVIVLLSSWMRRRMQYRFWRNVHYVSFIAFALVTAHGLLAGSDSAEAWMRGLYGFASASVGFLLLIRMFVGSPSASAA